MKKKPNVVAIIPARGGSTGIPRKNLKDFGGKPLVAHTIQQALSANTITNVFVNSEDSEIREVAVQHGAQVMDRPEKFHHDNTFQEVDRLLIWSVNYLEEKMGPIDIVVLLYPTAPLRKVRHIDECVSKIRDEGYDSALTVYEDSRYLWEKIDEEIRPTNYIPAERGPRQKEYWNQWAENKAVYSMTRNLLMDTGCRLGGKIGAVEMDEMESIDIDKPSDLELARSIYNLTSEK